MTDAVIIPMAGLAGILLGLVFFGGLWWTVRKGLASTCPAWWFLGSLLVRMGIVVTGFILVSAGRWERMAACLLGFLVARLVVTMLTRPPTADRSPTSPEITHAP
ncbi:MAG: ATP synthase subunit I [Planctomycetes bacterium]|nr:ATP synthase subunit I [Planctomycetota bacterium]